MPKNNDYSYRFETRLDRLNKQPRSDGFGDSFVMVHDTLEMASYIAESIFRDKATPDLTLKVYELLLQWRKKYIESKNDDFEPVDNDS